MKLHLKDISTPLHAFSLEVDQVLSGEITIIFGSSGSGKTTLLELIAGLRKPQRGTIVLDDVTLSDSTTGSWVTPQQRGLGYVPQDLALFPHLNTRQNLAYGINPKNPPRGQGMDWDSVVKLLELKDLLDRPISKLSGGEQQRVAFGRAILSHPRLLLLDEPLSNLDLPLKNRILPFLKRIRDHLKVPMLYVTHDRYEAIALGDQMCVMDAGHIVQYGTVQEIFRKPARLEVARLMAVETLLSGCVVEVSNGVIRVSAQGLNFVSPDMPVENGVSWAPSLAVHVCIRAEDIILTRQPDVSTSARNRFEGVVLALTRENFLYRVELGCGPSAVLTAWLTVQAVEQMRIETGHRLTAQIKAQHIHLIPSFGDGPQ